MHRGKVGFFASNRIVAHRNDLCNYFERFHGLLYGIWTHVAKSKEIVLDIKKKLVSNKSNCEGCTKDFLDSCELVLLRTVVRTVIIQTESRNVRCAHDSILLDMRMKENIIMKMISRRDFMKASAVVGAAGVLTACGGSSSSTAASSAASSTAASTAASSAAASTGSANIGVCIYQFADNFMTLYRTDLEEYLKDMGYAVTIVDGKNDQNTQTEQINTFLQQGVDVLVINPVQTTSAQTIVDTISPSGTPIVFINREPEKAVLDSYAGKCCYVGADARQSGTYQGELILETSNQGDINGDGKITYIMCKGDPENIDAQYRTEYSIKALTDAGKEVECLYEYLDNWDQTTAQQDVANALAQYGDKIEVVFCNNDAMALGALQSIEQAGRKVGEDIYLVGVDALKEAVQNVVDGKMTGTVLNDDVGQATAAADATKLFVEGKNVEEYYWVDYVKVTTENASQYL